VLCDRLADAPHLLEKVPRKRLLTKIATAFEMIVQSAFIESNAFRLQDRFVCVRHPFHATKRVIAVVCASIALDVDG
jgi:hypothetical protein